ncbi:ROK family protein [Candidatus Saccharibacteria bacterium]|nr:ROK family protein [Candidatus Saccharibacteria bacterium]
MYLSIDIGGTKTLLALFNRRGKMLRKYKFPTPKDPEQFIYYLQEHLSPLLPARKKLHAVTVAFPGVIKNGHPTTADNLPRWNNFPVGARIEALFSQSTPVYFANDASLASVFEAYRLRGKTIFLTFSTGIGGGIVQNNKLTKASNTFEPGHTKYTYDGQTLEWEDIASARSIGEHFGMVATNVKGAKNNREIAARIALGLPDIIKKYHPDTIVIGGPMGRTFNKFKKYLIKELKEQLGGPLPRLKKPKKPLESVVYGCYLYAKRQAKKS